MRKHRLGTLVGLAIVVAMAGGCAGVTVGGALLNDQNRKGARVVQATAVGLAASSDPAAVEAGKTIGAVGAQIEQNTITEAETTYKNFDLSTAPPYSAEASESAREKKREEDETGGVLGGIISAISGKSKIFAVIVGVLGSLYGTWQRSRGKRLGKALDSTISGTTKFLNGEKDGKETLLAILKDEHVQASAMPEVQKALDRVKKKIFGK